MPIRHPTPSFLSSPRRLATLALVLALGACGGGGGGGTASTGTGGTGSTGGSTGGTGSTTLPASVITGVAATGAPLAGATVRVVDATGQPVTLVDAAGSRVTSTTTSISDGSFRLTLASAQQNLPLLLQARGVDATGAPVVLHSTVASATAPLTAHITPLTDAIVGMVMGAPPQAVFGNASANTAALALLTASSAVTAASDQLKAIVKASLTDSAITDTKSLDFFKDATFATNKTGQDIILESLRLQYGKDTAGKDQLQLANKFLAPTTTEVRVDLATASTELAKTTGGTPANAIVSTLKATTSSSTVITTLANLENVSAGLNQLIARGAVAADFLASPLLPTTYTRHNGRTRAQLADLLAGYATTNSQLGKWQVVSCADDPVPAKTCVRVQVAALITSQAGEVLDVLTDAVTYTKPVSPSTVGWRLAGNNLGASVQVVPAAQLTLDAKLAAVASTVAAPNPSSGVQVLARALDYATPPAAAVGQLLVQLPTGFNVRFAACGSDQATLCLAPTAGTAPVATGTLADTLVVPSTTGWLGSVDAVRGARYTASYALLSAPTTTLSQPALLPADVPAGTALATSRFPALDTASAKALNAAALEAGATLSWVLWAADQADMKVFQVRSILRHGDPADTSATATPLVQVVDATLPPAGATSAKLPANPLPDGRAAVGRDLLVGAQDAAGRRYYTRIGVL